MIHRLIHLLLDELADVLRPPYTSLAALKNHLSDPDGDIDRYLPDVPDGGIDQAIGEVFFRDLLRYRFRRGDEHIVCDPFRLRRKDGHADRRKNEDVVPLSRRERPAFVRHGREGASACEDGSTGAPRIRLLGSAF